MAPKPETRAGLEAARAVPYRIWLLLAGVATTVLVFCSYTWWDAPIAHAIRRWLTGQPRGMAHAPHVPDLLLPLVVALTLGAWLARGLTHTARPRKCLTALGVVAPLSYICKDVAKFVFGRVKTRAWLIDPRAMDFHWLHGTGPYIGFPSGHMLVFTAIAAVLWRYYPVSRLLCVAVLLLLATSLLLLDYHFLSDIFAGAYMGLLLEWCVSGLNRAFNRSA